MAAIFATVHSQNRFSGARNMGMIINSALSDQAPAIAPSGLSMYFASNRTGTLGQTDLYVSQRPTLNSPWEAPQNLGATINSISTESGSSFSLDGRTMFFQSGRSGNADIYISTRTDPNDDFSWAAPISLGSPVNSSFIENAPTYFEDPATGAGSLIFSSDRDGTPGISLHFYQSTRNPDGTFNAPTPINELNSVGAEFGATIRRDGLEVFFASSRPGGLADPFFDIWVSTRASTNDPWHEPVLAAGINSLEEDRLPKLSPDGSILYYQSARTGGSGGFDLYAATRCSLYTASPCAVNKTVADFDADGTTDLSVFRPSDGSWWVFNSGSATVRAEQFGATGDKPVTGDYDGDNRIDLAIFRPSTGDWWILPSLTGPPYVVRWGIASDQPIPGDYDGDGKTDPSVFRDGTWYILQSSDGQMLVRQFGQSGDIPAAALNAE